MLLIMLVAGLLGGGINYVLQSYRDEPSATPVRPIAHSLLLGIGATFLVPIFLKLTDSKIMDNIQFSFSNHKPAVDSTGKEKLPADTIVVNLQADSNKSISYKVGNIAKSKSPKNETGSDSDENETGKNYFLWMAYCLLAASAGFKFINMLINNLVKDEQLKQATAKNQELTTKFEVQKKIDEKEAAKAEQKAKEALVQNTVQKSFMVNNEPPKVPLLPQLPPVKYADDPQKGRFGGQSQKNFRTLAASVKPTDDAFFYEVTIWVESTDQNEHPLEGEVIFYLHHSFRPSVTTIPVKDGKATLTIEAFGAFTVGVITDLGQTLLELDLSKDRSFPADFRSR